MDSVHESFASGPTIAAESLEQGTNTFFIVSYSLDFHFFIIRFTFILFSVTRVYVEIYINGRDFDNLLRNILYTVKYTAVYCKNIRLRLYHDNVFF